MVNCFILLQVFVTPLLEGMPLNVVGYWQEDSSCGASALIAVLIDRQITFKLERAIRQEAVV